LAFISASVAICLDPILSLPTSKITDTSVPATSVGEHSGADALYQPDRRS
jgi:hypothetical protein